MLIYQPWVQCIRSVLVDIQQKRRKRRQSLLYMCMIQPKITVSPVSEHQSKGENSIAIS